LVGQHGSIDDVGEPAFGNSKGFHAASAVKFSPLQQFASWWVEPGLGQCDAVQCRVEFPIAGA
jgi:hypothetical protein